MQARGEPFAYQTRVCQVDELTSVRAREHAHGGAHCGSGGFPPWIQRSVSFDGTPDVPTPVTAPGTAVAIPSVGEVLVVGAAAGGTGGAITGGVDPEGAPMLGGVSGTR